MFLTLTSLISHAGYLLVYSLRRGDFEFLFFKNFFPVLCVVKIQ